MPRPIDPATTDLLGDIIYASRQRSAAIVAIAIASYAFAWHLWTRDQWLGAIVIATMGYALLRSLRNIVFNLLWRKFRGKPEYSELIAQLPPHIITRREAVIRQHIEEKSTNSPKKHTPAEKNIA